jgi:general nucleoside transport system permease protein
MLGPALLKLRFGADEVVTTLLINFIMLLFVQMMLEGALQDPMSLGWPQSAPIIDEAVLPALFHACGSIPACSSASSPLSSST